MNHKSSIRKHHIKPTHTSHSRTRDSFSRGSRLESSSPQESQCLKRQSFFTSSTACRTRPRCCFLHNLSTISLSTCTPVRPSTRPSLMSASHGALPCADPSNVSFDPLAETHSPTGYEPKDLTEEDTSILVKPMFIYRPSMTSTLIQLRTLRLTLLNRIWMMIKYGICWLHRCAYRREKQVPTDHEFITLSAKNSVTSSSHFRESAGKPSAVFSSQETLFDREVISLGHQPVQGKGKYFFRFSDPERAARTVLEEQRDHQLAEAKSEIFKEKCKVDTLNTCIREFRRQAHSNRLDWIA